MWNVQCILAVRASLRFACLLLLFNRFFGRQWIFLLHFFNFDLSNFSISAISGLSDMVAEEAEGGAQTREESDLLGDRRRINKMYFNK